jgi:hypothetical protein
MIFDDHKKAGRFNRPAFYISTVSTPLQMP